VAKTEIELRSGAANLAMRQWLGVSIMRLGFSWPHYWGLRPMLGNGWPNHSFHGEDILASIESATDRPMLIGGQRIKGSVHGRVQRKAVIRIVESFRD
jgi:hypothetical protein